MKQNDISVGVVGCGRMGQIRAEGARRWGASVVEAYDPNPAAAQKVAELAGSCRIASRLDELSWDRLDALFICTPPNQRSELEARCIEFGIPFLTEKPLGLSAEQTRDTSAAIRKLGLITAVGYMNRYRAGVRKVRAMLAGDDLIGGTCHWLAGIYKVPWWSDGSQSGGPLNEQAAHLVDLIRFLMGEIIEVQGGAQPFPDNSSLIRSASFSLLLESGVYCSLFYSCAATEKMMRLNAFTANRDLELRGWDFRWTGEQPDETHRDRNAIFHDETAAFFEAITIDSPAPILSSYEDAHRTQMALDAIRRAVQSNRVEHVLAG